MDFESNFRMMTVMSVASFWANVNFGVNLFSLSQLLRAFITLWLRPLRVEILCKMLVPKRAMDLWVLVF